MQVPDWVRDRYPFGVEELLRVEGEVADFPAFFWKCVIAAEITAGWRRAYADGFFDENEAKRRQDADYLRELPAIITAARRLVQHIDRFPFQSAVSLSEALLVLKEQTGTVPLITKTSDAGGVNPFGYGRGSAQDVTARYLEAFAAKLEEAPRAKAGPFSHRHNVGWLHYYNPVDVRTARPDALSTGLLFSLALYARAFSSNPPLRLGKGMTMPETGKPMWTMAASFLNEALGEAVTDKQARDRVTNLIKQNEHLGWTSFAPPPWRYMNPPPGDSWYEKTFQESPH